VVPWIPRFPPGLEPTDEPRSTSDGQRGGGQGLLAGPLISHPTLAPPTAAKREGDDEVVLNQPAAPAPTPDRSVMAPTLAASDPGPDLTPLAALRIAGGDPSEVAALAHRLTAAEQALGHQLAELGPHALSRAAAIQILKDTGLSAAEARSLFYARAGRSWFDAGGRVTPVGRGLPDASRILGWPTDDEPDEAADDIPDLEERP
jgi:hypothetical protein